MIGKVWLVGAGPSNYGLLTIKAKEVLECAEVVVYDRLVGEEILMLIPENAVKIDVGKRSGNHPIPQDEINRILLNQAQNGKKVVRLKGGDPFLFGRGGEELELLYKNSIPFEIVPGVTSAISVPAFNGIPVTHRNASSSLHIITGHKKGSEPYDIDFEALVRVKGTLVFLMGVSALGEICKGLLAGGMNQDTEAALLIQGTTSRQKKVVATISTLQEEVQKHTIETPAIIIVGKVCSYSEDFSWYEKLPLSGSRIIVTRPKERISETALKLRQAGAQVLEIPAIRTVKIEQNNCFDEILSTLSDYHYIAFTSPAGVRIFFDSLKEKRMDIRNIGQAKIAAIGEGTKKEIENLGIFVDYIPDVYDGRELGILLGRICKDGERILIPRAKNGNKSLIEEIQKQKSVTITDVAIYETVYETNHTIIDQKKEIDAGRIDMAVFTSASTVKGFCEVTKGADYTTLKAVCIGNQTREAAKALGLQTVTAKTATIDALVEAAIETAQQKKKEGLQN